MSRCEFNVGVGFVAFLGIGLDLIPEMIHEDGGVVDVEEMGVFLEGVFSIFGLSKIDGCIIINVDVFCKGNVVMVGWVLVERDGFFAFSDDDMDVFKRDVGVFGTIDKGG